MWMIDDNISETDQAQDECSSEFLLSYESVIHVHQYILDETSSGLMFDPLTRQCLQEVLIERSLHESGHYSEVALENSLDVLI